MSTVVLQPSLPLLNSSATLIQAADIETGPDKVLVYGPFRCFFRTDTGPHAPLDATASQHEDLPDFIEQQMALLQAAYNTYTSAMALPDFFTTGYMQERGIRFLDLVLEDLPVQRGLAGAKVQENSPAWLHAHPDFCGPSVTLKLHHGLATQNLTVAHELFHVFQYAALPLRNMWFMEGLARHAQRWLAPAPITTEPLPASQQELEALLHRWHDAEYFWNRLDLLCMPASADCTPAPTSFTPTTRSSLLSTFFQHLATAVSDMRAAQPDRSLDAEQDDWPLHEQRSASNNRWILRALHDALQALVPAPAGELAAFLALLVDIEASYATAAQDPNVQMLLQTLAHHTEIRVRTHPAGFLECDAFDPVLRTLSAPELRFPSNTLDAPTQSRLSAMRSMIGNLVLASQHQLTELSGLDALEAIEGSIQIESTALIQLNGLNRLSRIKGSLTLKDNAQLQEIGGFQALVSIDQKLTIENHPMLTAITGFEQLVEIKKGELVIVSAPALENLQSFGKLQRARGLHLSKLAISNLDTLRGLFKRNPHFPGRIILTHSNLSNIEFMQGLRKVASSIYLYGNRLTQLRGLEQLEEVGASLSLAYNQLYSLQHLGRLAKVAGLLDLSHNALRSLAGLEHLQYLQTTLWNRHPQTLRLHGNPDLSDITAIQHILTPDRYLILTLDRPAQYRRKPLPDSPFHQNILQIQDMVAQAPVPTWTFVKKEQQDYSHFRKATHNKKLVYLRDFETTADTLVLSFSGVNGNLGSIFYNRFPLITDNLRTHKIFINDTRHLWYHGGIPGLTRNIDETLEHIKTLIQHRNYQKIVCFGVSMGAYMALLVGRSIRATHIIAFAPQTFLASPLRQRHGDTRWSSLLKHLPNDIPPSYLDLAEFYRTTPAAPCHIQIHYGSQMQLDCIHAQHLAQAAPGLQLCSHDTDRHEISIYLDRVLGQLNPLISRVMTDPVPADHQPASRSILFSVVITAYNIETYLPQAITSVLGQSFTDYEILVIDDGSTDATPDVASRLLADTHQHRVISQSNRGPGGARNTGIQHAQGKYLLFLDGDDWLEPNALAVFAEAIQDQPDAVFANRKWYSESTGLWRQETTYTTRSCGPVGPGRSLLRRFACSGKVFRRNFLLEHRIVFPEKMIWEDYPFAYRILAHAADIHTLTEHVYIALRRQGQNPSITQRKRLKPDNLSSRFTQIDMCRDIVARSRLREQFPAFNFDRIEFEVRLMADIHHLARPELDRQEAMTALATFADFVSKHRMAIRQAVSRPAWPVFQAILDQDLDQVLITLTRHREKSLRA